MSKPLKARPVAIKGNLNEARPKKAKITLNDGKERTLKFTLNAMAELEERYGSVEEAFKQLEANSIKAARCVLWAGLIWEEPTLTEYEVGNLIDLDTLQELMGTVETALTSDMPIQDNNAQALSEGTDPNE